MLDLAMVMPVYNEEECIEGVIQSWLKTLESLDIQFRMIVLNDGSRDGSLAALQKIKNKNLEVVDKPNSGHGPTIRKGYEMGTEIAEWVFQCDSDDEMQPDSFPKLWEKRAEHDILFGIRDNRSQSLARKVITRVSRMTVRLLYGGGVTDVNTPYRLIRAELLAQILPQIPGDTFAPNVIISGVFAKARKRIYEINVPHLGRRTGTVSIMKWNLWKSAIKAFRQTLTTRPSFAAK